jgi:hypothetical protein
MDGGVGSGGEAGGARSPSSRERMPERSRVPPGGGGIGIRWDGCGRGICREGCGAGRGGGWSRTGGGGSTRPVNPDGIRLDDCWPGPGDGCGRGICWEGCGGSGLGMRCDDC